MTRKNQIAVIGSSDESPILPGAVAIGRFIAEQGHVLITGGRGGVMEAASRGAAEAGGIVIGILPGESLDSSNRYCSIVIPTGLGFARNAVNILSADAVVAIGGSYGTLSELAYASMYDRPLICCTFAGGWSAEFARSREASRAGGPVYIAHTAGEACRHLATIFGNR
ncbi:MAG TPA: TIGR00725 family protein [Spirochaetota bacterium]|nr:TIGR00725 family protein [Spirochaetota bacterium]HOD14188.1 TIGR00725 family protein [Spirochaetota bacterium]HPG50891.1 TIGR00725 family protein [Spirochaetota bacterium]HPN13957.1 TIGR00725 family protein [Spirochaetota bacterium]HQL82530.1 TIGR00725 family protein [Spirochaetota bacterium]